MTPIRVLVVDDSASARSLILELLRPERDIDVVGEAGDGIQAVREAKRLLPDVITMDVAMPRMDGIEAIRQIMASEPCRIVVVSAVVGQPHSADLSLRAIESGALELVPKPTSVAGDLERFARRLLTSIRLMAEVPIVRRRPTVAAAPAASRVGDAARRPTVSRASTPPPSSAGTPTGRVDVVAMVASTGGPPALAAILGALPASYPVPVLVAQHMAPGFVGGLHRWLASVTALDVRLASSGDWARAGRVYLPPDGCHLELGEGGVLRVEPADTGHSPSGDRLLSSVARVYRARSAGIVLTGMGTDGAEGLLAIAREGGVTWAQDEESSIVFGMPRAALDNGGATTALPLSRIADALLGLVRLPPPVGS